LIQISVNGGRAAVPAEPGSPLLLALRNDLGLKAAKLGCALEQCGACTVLVDGEPRTSCTTPLDSIGSAEVTTLEALASDPSFQRLREAFLAEQAAQCGYCLPGILVTAHALLERTPQPTRADVVAALDGHLCRCGSHPRILRAVERAAGVRP
jgi:nicotinate dehydrogenase subunit A